MSHSPLERNPFYVLGVPADASPREVEREGAKLLGMLSLGLEAARRYATPLGQRVRDADMVREALAELRDPQRRLAHELWARLDAAAAPEASAPAHQEAANPRETTEPAAGSEDGWPALAAFGWRAR